jgi:pilus assembly protein TadC
MTFQRSAIGAGWTLHRPAILAGALAAAAAAFVFSGRDTPRARLQSLLAPPPATQPPGHRAAPRRSSARVLAALGSGGGAVAVLGLPIGLVVGVVVGAFVYRVVPTAEAVAALVDQQSLRAAAPLACDLVAAALAAGAPIVDAVRLAAAAVTGPLAALLDEVAASLDLGAPPHEAWAAVERAPPLRQLARSAARSASSGAAMAAALTAVADDLREAAHVDGQVAARRAGVRLVGPLTLCFLPAFVALTVVPLVISLLPSVLP